MTKGYRIIVESYNTNNPALTLNKTIVSENVIEKPTSLANLSMGLSKQIEVISSIQDFYVTEKISLVTLQKTCPCCKGKLKKFGHHTSSFHDVLTDHMVKIQRLKCTMCDYETSSTIRTLFNGNQSAELMRIQAEIGAEHSFRDAEKLLSLFSNKRRTVNNHERVKQTTEMIGEVIEDVRKEENEIIATKPASELILNVDGGHVKTTEDTRSIEAMTSVIYNPLSLVSNEAGTRNEIESKHCAASVKADGQKQLIESTITAALKQGLSRTTHITALCDGADNCWNVVDALAPLAGSVTRILDWFHLAKKIKNIALPQGEGDKLMLIKWHLWRGRIDRARIRLNEMITRVDDMYQDRLTRLLAYINNNEDKIVDYRARKNAGLVFTSQLAESTVESLINKRCKGKQHMRWSREGLNPILQIRAAMGSDDWNIIREMAVMNVVNHTNKT
jgi:hypothetical protein